MGFVKATAARTFRYAHGDRGQFRYLVVSPGDVVDDSLPPVAGADCFVPVVPSGPAEREAFERASALVELHSSELALDAARTLKTSKLGPGSRRERAGDPAQVLKMGAIRRKGREAATRKQQQAAQQERRDRLRKRGILR